MLETINMASSYSLYAVIAKQTMIDGVPTLPQRMVGDPSMHGLFGAYHFLCICAQLQVTALCVLNYLFCVVPLSLWPQHADIRTVTYVNQRLLPVPECQSVYPFGATVSHIQAIKDIWLYNAKNWLKVKNMNTALTDTLMKLLPLVISAGYAKVLINDPNRKFGIALQ